MLYTDITQLMTHTTKVYIAAAYLLTMSLSLLAIKSQKVYIYILNTAKVDTFSLRKGSC